MGTLWGHHGEAMETPWGHHGDIGTPEGGEGNKGPMEGMMLWCVMGMGSGDVSSSIMHGTWCGHACVPCHCTCMCPPCHRTCLCHLCPMLLYMYVSLMSHVSVHVSPHVPCHCTCMCPPQVTTPAQASHRVGVASSTQRVWPQRAMRWLTNHMSGGRGYSRRRAGLPPRGRGYDQRGGRSGPRSREAGG